MSFLILVIVVFFLRIMSSNSAILYYSGRKKGFKKLSDANMVSGKRKEKKIDIVPLRLPYCLIEEYCLAPL